MDSAPKRSDANGSLADVMEHDQLPAESNASVIPSADSSNSGLRSRVSGPRLLLWIALAGQIGLVQSGVRAIAYMQEWLRVMNPSHAVPWLPIAVQDYRCVLWLLPVLTGWWFWRLSARPLVGWRKWIPEAVMALSLGLVLGALRASMVTLHCGEIFNPDR